MTTPDTLPGFEQELQVVRLLADTVDSTTSAVDVLGRVSEALLGAVPADIWYAALLDPSTLLDTGGVAEQLLSDELEQPVDQ